MDFPQEINDDVNNLPKKKLSITSILSLVVLTLLLAIGVAVNINSSKQYGTARSRASENTPSANPTPTVISIKKGVGGDPTNIANIQTLGIKWSYSWYPNIIAFNQNLYEHIPMITASMRKSNQLNYTNIKAIAANHPSSYWLIFNEPDYHQQDNISSTTGAIYFKEFYDIIHKIDPNSKFIVGGIYADLNWLTNFISEYKRLNNNVFPPVVGWSAHIYFGRDDYTSNGFRNRLNATKTWLDNPINNNGSTKEFWLTEWGCLNSTSVAKQIMIDQTPYLESLDWVTRYSWFNYFIDSNDVNCPGCTGSLTNPDDTLNDLGNTYATFTSSPISNSFTPTLTPTVSILTPTTTPIINFTPTPTPIPNLIYALGINSGGTRVDIGNKIFRADRAYIKGSFGYISSKNETYSTTNTIPGLDSILYKTERYNLTGYKFDNIPNGNYQIILKFAEIYSGCYYVGCRIFDVSIQGTKMLTNFDIFASAQGKNKAIDKTFYTKVTDNILDIGFTKVTNSPKINAIYIFKK